MTEHTRKLAAVMFADIAGFTSMMQADERLANAMRRRQRDTVYFRLEEYRGAVAQIYGDGCLCVFDSAVDAVMCGIAMQRDLRKEPSVPLRIGIHMGEVVFDDEGIYGDSVNIAARIESLSAPGAVLLSAKVNGELKNHPECPTIAVGDFAMKNVTGPIKLYAVNMDGLTVPEACLLRSPKAVPVRSVAVLPFVNMSSNRENEYFCDGITEELINALVRIDGLKVSARTSSFAFKGRNDDVRILGKKLGVDTVLEGSVRRSADRVRITAQLINTKDGFHLFSEMWDRHIDDVFMVQTEIAQAIASRLETALKDESRFFDAGICAAPAEEERPAHVVTPSGAEDALLFRRLKKLPPSRTFIALTPQRNN